MTYLYSLFSFFLILTFYAPHASAEIRGKVDAGPAYVHIDLLESNKTVKRMDLWAARADGFVMPFSGTGWTIKPMVLYGTGGSMDRGELFTCGVGIGHCLPYQDFVFTPLVGTNYTFIQSNVNITALGGTRMKETFHSISPYLGLEVVYNILNDLRICGVFQYAWSRTSTTIGKVVKNSKSNTKGPCYSGMIEYDINDCFSVNVGMAYNLTLSKEKHGVRGYGTKIGFAYWF